MRVLFLIVIFLIANWTIPIIFHLIIQSLCVIYTINMFKSTIPVYNNAVNIIAITSNLIYKCTANARLRDAWVYANYVSGKNKDTHLFFRELQKQYGKMSRIRLGSKNCLILFDPELISEVMAHEGPYPERYPVPLMETYAKRTKRAMFNLQYT